MQQLTDSKMREVSKEQKDPDAKPTSGARAPGTLYDGKESGTRVLEMLHIDVIH